VTSAGYRPRTRHRGNDGQSLRNFRRAAHARDDVRVAQDGDERRRAHRSSRRLSNTRDPMHRIRQPSRPRGLLRGPALVADETRDGCLRHLVQRERTWRHARPARADARRHRATSLRLYSSVRGWQRPHCARSQRHRSRRISAIRP
jgi:hypothetical protein